MKLKSKTELIRRFLQNPALYFLQKSELLTAKNANTITNVTFS